MEHEVLTIENIEKVTHNVLRFTLSKSDSIHFVPGQAAEIAIDKEGWDSKGNPFTFTSLPNDDHFEFTIKIYPNHEGVTNELSKLKVGDHLIIKDVFGAIHYKGKGTFIAGGAGVTPYISIIRDLKSQDKLSGNRLIFANTAQDDIINKEEFESVLGNDFLNILSNDETAPYAHGYIDSEYLKKNIESMDGYFYVCGPRPMMKAVVEALKRLGVKKEMIVKEVF